MTAMLTHFLAAIIGAVVWEANARFQIRKAEALRRDLAAELRSPVDADFQVVVRHAEGAV